MKEYKANGGAGGVPVAKRPAVPRPAAVDPQMNMMAGVMGGAGGNDPAASHHDDFDDDEEEEDEDDDGDV